MRQNNYFFISKSEKHLATRLHSIRALNPRPEENLQLYKKLVKKACESLRSLWLLIFILAVKKQTFVTEINLDFNLDFTYHEDITQIETFIYSSFPRSFWLFDMWKYATKQLLLHIKK